MNPSASNFDPNYYNYNTAAAGGPPEYYETSNGDGEADYYAGDDYAATSTYYEAAPAGSYTLTSLWSVLDPVTALAYDIHHDALYVAGSATSMSGGRRLNDHRASMLTTHSTSDGLLYASVAGHPEAPPSILKALYDAVYGVVSTGTGGVGGSRHIPAHAFRPPFGTDDPSTPTIPGKKSYQMGINTLLAVDGGVASVSPSGVRLHAMGGCQVVDRHVEGMLTGTRHPGSGAMTTHLAVGGLSVDSEKGSVSTTGRPTTSKQQVLCLDLWQDLRTVASYSIDRYRNSSTAVTAMATNEHKGSVLAGCSDGQVRMLDGRLRELAVIKSHIGGVTSVAVSPDGTLLATAGFGSRGRRSTASPALYAYPDPSVLIYDIRYLGRGGIAHPFAGMRGGPRHLAFVPDVEGQPSNRLLVASGQSGGGMQIMEPFAEHASENAANFILPPLERDSITALHLEEDNLALGTSSGNVLQYKLEGYGKGRTKMSTSTTSFVKGGIFRPSSMTESSGSAKKAKVPLEIPSFEPKPPPLSIEASLLQREDPNVRLGMTPQIRNILTSYLLTRDPTVTAIGDASSATTTTFGHLAASPLVAPSKLQVASSLMAKATHAMDFMHTIPTANLNVDLLVDHRPERVKARIKGKPIKPNPNKLLYNNELFPVAYEESLNRSKKQGRRSHRGGRSNSGEEQIPNRYRLLLRPTHKSASSFNHAESNDTGIVPGWDYPPSMPNAFIPPVLMLLYLVPEMKAAISAGPHVERALVSTKEKSLLPELVYLFHRIDSLSRFAMLFPESNGGTAIAKVGAWAPSNFISCLSAMPEAEQLQILDGSPAAVDAPRRPEAFYRFLLYQIDKEVEKESNSRQLDRVGGVDFVSINQFISGSDPASESMTRAMTVELFYDNFFGIGPDADQKYIRFGNVLQRTLCRETRLRAWSQGSKSYETIVQHKIVTSLPSVLSLSCGCAGRKDEEGLKLWRGSDNWLPEMIEIELDKDNNVMVRELDDATGNWVECKAKRGLPESITEIVSRLRRGNTICKRRFRLDAVLSMVRDDFDPNCAELLELIEGEPSGHHVLHARVSKAFQRQALSQQIELLEQYILHASSDAVAATTVVGPAAEDGNLSKRLALAKGHLSRLEPDDEVDWVLINGYCVSKTCVEDARAFHVKFKEPSLVVFRAADEPETPKVSPTLSLADPFVVPVEAMKTSSLTNGSKSALYSSQRLNQLPGKGDLIAFDAEFVSVQEEESTLNETGSKMIVREMRYALARISVMDCRTRSVILDDHVLPREPVVDYLTRFSGIVAEDLDPKQSPHHLISTRSAYLKLRHLMERGCIFVGHGVQQDFWTVNLAVPASQIIDTVEIYHKPAQRYISLRFLTNFVLGRDMQQDVHDSVEDAMAAFELYEKAVEFKAAGKFDKLLDELYVYGQKTDWKLGVDQE